MANTVAIFGATGSLGKATLLALVQSHQEKKIRLVVFHRPSSDLTSLNIPSDIEARAIDSDSDGNEAEQIKALSGIDTIISTAAFAAADSQTKLIQLLGKTQQDTVFIPARYSALFDGARYPELAGVEAMQRGFHTLGDSLNVKTAGVNTGAFTEYFFGYGFVGVDVKGNTARLNEGQLKNKFPISSREFIGKALAELASRPKASLAGKFFSAVEYWVSGAEIVSALKEVHGSDPQIVDDGPVTFNPDSEDPLALVRSGYAVHWQDGSFAYPDQIQVTDWEAPNLVSVMSQFK